MYSLSYLICQGLRDVPTAAKFAQAVAEGHDLTGQKAPATAQVI
jgi:hypothetical protein